MHTSRGHNDTSSGLKSNLKMNQSEVCLFICQLSVILLNFQYVCVLSFITCEILLVGTYYN